MPSLRRSSIWSPYIDPVRREWREEAGRIDAAMQSLGAWEEDLAVRAYLTVRSSWGISSAIVSNSIIVISARPPSVPWLSPWPLCCCCCSAQLPGP